MKVSTNICHITKQALVTQVCNLILIALIASQMPGAVGTLPQELNALQLTGEPVMVQRKKKLSGAQWKCLRKQREVTAVQQADGGPGARGAHSSKLCTGTDASTDGSSRTKRPLSPGGTPQGTQSQVKCTNQKQKETPYNS